MSLPLVVHPHLHPRRTGVTRHVEAVLPGIGAEVEARALGEALDPAVPRIGWGELWHRIRTGPVVWHAHRNNELVLGLILRGLGRQVRLVFTRHASVPPGRLTRALARRADRLISLTPAIAQTVNLPSTVVSHGVDLARFSPPADRDAAWQALGFPGKHGVGVLGRVRPEKGQQDFVAALQDVLPRYPEWHALLVGMVRPQHRAFAQGLRAAAGPAVSFVGEQTEVVPWYRGLQVVVHPSQTEGFSMVHVEAMACGCCVVASRLPYLPTVIEHGRTGFLYEPGDVDGLRAILARLMAHPDEARRVGEQAAQEARRRFGVDGEVARLLEVYRPLLSAQ